MWKNTAGLIHKNICHLTYYVSLWLRIRIVILELKAISLQNQKLKDFKSSWRKLCIAWLNSLVCLHLSSVLILRTVTEKTTVSQTGLKFSSSNLLPLSSRIRLNRHRKWGGFLLEWLLKLSISFILKVVLYLSDLHNKY
jgi:hypothetical protein